MGNTFPEIYPNEAIQNRVSVSAQKLLFGIATKGLAGTLEHIAASQPEHPDIITTEPPFGRELLIVSSHRTLMDLTRPSTGGCPFDRHASLGVGSIGQKIFGDKDDTSVGVSQGKLEGNHPERTREVSNLFASLSPEAVAVQTTNELKVGLQNGSSIEKVVSDVLLKTVLEDMVGTGGHDMRELYGSSRRRLVVAFLSGLLKPSIQEHLGVGANVYSMIRGQRQEFRDIAKQHEQLTASDAMHLYAATPAIISPTYWVVDRVLSTPLDERAELDVKAIATESLRIAPSTLMPARRSSLGKNEDSLTLVSPHVMLRDPSVVGENPAVFDETRFDGTEGEARRKRVNAVVFGYGGHHCPAGRFTLAYLNSLGEQLQQDRSMLTTKGLTNRPNKWRTNSTMPRVRHQAKLATINER